MPVDSTVYEKRKYLCENIKNLVKSEYEQFYRILKKYKQDYTENSNGIFFDVTIISEECFTEMEKYMDFCLHTRQDDKNRVTEMAEVQAEVNRLIDEHKADVSN